MTRRGAPRPFGGTPAARPSRRLLTVTWIVLSLFGAAGRARSETPGEAPLFDAGLDTEVGRILERSGSELSADQVTLDAEGLKLYGGPARPLGIHEILTRSPLRAPALGSELALAALRSAGTPYDLVTGAGARQDHSIRPGLLGDPTEAAWRESGTPDALFNALGGLFSEGRRLQGKLRDDLRRTVPTVPQPIGRVAAYLLIVSRDALDWQKRACHDAPVGRGAGAAPFEDAAVTFLDSLGGALPRDVRERVEGAAARVDFEALNGGAAILAIALRRAAAVLDSSAVSGRFHFVCDTPMGRVALGGEGADAYSGGHLLVIDTGGNDTYRGAGQVRRLDRPIALVLDAAGDDRYESADSAGAGPGGAVCGYAAVVDLQGNDSYSAGNIGLGAGLFGVGLLWDRQGDDTYAMRSFGEGAGLHGLGILSDEAGRDQYTVLQSGQGFGAPGGVGWLLDAGGDDEYLASDVPLDFPSSQTPDRNTSLAQGCGLGYRADYQDGHSLPGGFGLLADGGGNDRYRASVFGQGAGYWFGTGLLVDCAGNDVYDGAWYAQGAAAHFAAGLLLEGAGDDTFRVSHNMGEGAGHDFSLGLLADASGDDSYTAPNLGLGSGNENGVGILLELSGSDTYAAAKGGFALGAAAGQDGPGMRRALRTTGLFLDFSGKDAYPADRMNTADGRTWLQGGSSAPPPRALRRGFGIDAAK
jgi:hypothetical protein